MKTLPSKTKFQHQHECWNCFEPSFKGHWDYCENCEEPHFVCLRCFKWYRTDGSKVYPEIRNFSTKTKKEMK